MSILCKVNGIPVFYEKRNALAFGRQFLLQTVHTHTHAGRVGYMPGNNHDHAVSVIKGSRSSQQVSTHEDTLLKNWAGSETNITNIQTQPTPPPMENQENIVTTNPSTPSGGGGY
tara:strand:+ start:162 stop:506 length:345 start_codon:yes stop_codon:yes gene_type:complete